MNAHRLRVVLISSSTVLALAVVVAWSALRPKPPTPLRVEEFRDDADAQRALAGKTEEEVCTRLGEPSRVETVPASGQTVWVYDMGAHSLHVYFEADGTVGLVRLLAPAPLLW